MPTLPFDQGCLEIHVNASSPSVSGGPKNVVVPFGEEATAFVHLDEGVAALDRLELIASCRAARHCGRPRN